MRQFELKLRRRGISEAEIIADLKAVAQGLSEVSLTAITYDRLGTYGSTTAIRRFGSWNKTLIAAGLALNNRINIPDEELFENLADVWQLLGRQPVGNDIDKNAGTSKFSLGTYEKRFGSWNKALVAFIEYIENPGDETELSSMGNSNRTQSRRTPRKINWRLRAMILIKDSCVCKMCGASPAKDPAVTLHVDHKHPWSKGGETVFENLQTLCATCNIGKSDEILL